MRSRHARPKLSALAYPSAEQSPDLFNHYTDMFVLTTCEPLPFVYKAKIQSDFIQVAVSIAQRQQSLLTAMRLCVEECFLKVENSIGQAPRHHKPLCFRELLCFRQYPAQKVECARQDYHVICHIN